MARKNTHNANFDLYVKIFLIKKEEEKVCLNRFLETTKLFPFEVKVEHCYSIDDANFSIKPDVIFCTELESIRRTKTFLSSLRKLLPQGIPIVFLSENYKPKKISEYFKLGIEDLILYEQVPFYLEKFILTLEKDTVNPATFQDDYALPMWLLDENANFVKANKKALELSQDTDPKAFEFAFSQDIRTRNLQVLSSRTTQLEECDSILLDGLHRLFYFDRIPICDPKGNIEGLLIIGKENKEAHFSLEKNDLKSIADTAGIAYWELDVMEQEFDINDSFLETLGYTRDEFNSDPAVWLNQIMDETQGEKLWEMIEGTFPYFTLDTLANKDCFLNFHHKEGHLIQTYNKLHSVERNGKLKITGIFLNITEQRVTQEALSKSELRLKQAERLSKSSYWEFDFNKERIEFSNEMLNLIPSIIDDKSYTLAEIFGILNLEQKEKRELLQHVFKAINSSKESTYNFRVNIPEIKQDKWFRHRIIKLHSGNILGTIQDITDSKKTEQSLEESKSKYKMLIEQASDSIITFDKNGKILQANSLTSETLNYSSQELKTFSLEDIFKPKDAKKILQSLKSPSREEKKNLIEKISFVEKRKKRIPVELSTKKLPNNTYQAIIRDVSERIKQEEELHKTHTKTEMILKSIPDTMMMVNKEGLILDYYDEDGKKNEIINTYLYQRFDKKVHEKIHNCFLLAVERKTTSIVEFTSFHKHTKKFYEARVRAVTSIDYLVILRDITSKRTTEKNLKEVDNDLETFMYKASHNLKGPVSTMQGLFQIIELEKKCKEDSIYLEHLKTSVNKLNTTLEELVEVTTVKQGLINPAQLDFAQIIESIQKSIPKDLGIEIELFIKEDIQSGFYSDAYYIKLILKEIMQNAVQYRRLNTKHKIAVSISVKKEACSILIKDNGTGVDKKSLNKAFNMFYKASETSQGSGLGLYMCKQAIKKLKGEIRIENNDSYGSTVTLTIPDLQT